MSGRRVAALLAALAVLLAACGPSATSAVPSLAPGSPAAAAASPSATPALSSAPSATASAASAPSPSAPSLSEATPSASRFAHIYLVVMENQEYGSIVGSGDAPYLNGLIARYGLVTSMHAVTHPSEPNYLALASGGTQGVRDDGVYNLDVPSLFDQVEAAGRTWHVYEQGFPGGCSAVASTGSVADGPGEPGEYARKHNPAISLTSISRNPSRCARITGLAGFDPAAADFELIVPNQRNDMHSAPVRTGDDFLRAFLPSILGSAAFSSGSLLIVTWDEGSSNDGGGGHIATVVATPGMAPGTRYDVAATHYSVLRAIEDAWGMPALGGAADASAIPVRP
ncbi:MAG TPA: alkaline phosphatase family protein [Candidatus Limnocylindrales bacterium]